MIIEEFVDKEEWMLARRGRITGSKLNDIYAKRATGKKIGFYELIAEKLGIPGDGEPPMDRGNRLEGEAIGFFEQELGVEVDTNMYIWSREDNPNIAISPDGVIDRETAVEVKCLSSAKHIKALVEQEIPDNDYYMQALQYFIVNDELQTLYFVFYDPRILVKPLHYLTITREKVQEEIDIYLQFERDILIEVKTLVNQLSNF